MFGMKQIKFMKREDVVAELNESGAQFTDSAELKELKELLKEIRERKDEPITGITTTEPESPPEPPVAPKVVEVPLDTERLSDQHTETLMRYVGGHASLRIGKYAVTDADPFVLVQNEDVEKMIGKGFAKASDEQLKAYYA